MTTSTAYPITFPTTFQHLLSPHQTTPIRLAEPSDMERSASIMAAAAFANQLEELHNVESPTSPSPEALAAVMQEHAQTIGERHMPTEPPQPDDSNDRQQLHQTAEGFSHTLGITAVLSRSAGRAIEKAGPDSQNQPNNITKQIDAAALAGHSAALLYHIALVIQSRNDHQRTAHALAAWTNEHALRTIIENIKNNGHIQNLKRPREALQLLNSANALIAFGNHRPQYRSPETQASFEPNCADRLAVQLRRSTQPNLFIHAYQPSSRRTITAYRYQGADYLKHADEPYQHQLDVTAKLNHAYILELLACNSQTGFQEQRDLLHIIEQMRQDAHEATR